MRWWQTYEQRRAEQRELHRIALHEAAHAVVVFASGPGVEVTRVCLSHDDGCCEWRGVAGGPDIPARTFMLAALAGPCADRLFGGYEPDFDHGDYQDARNAARRFVYENGKGVGDTEVVLRQGERDARELVQRYADAIRELAIELLHKRELTGNAVCTLLAGRVPRGGPMPDGLLARKTPARVIPRAYPIDRAKPSVRPPERPAARVLDVPEFRRRCDGYLG